ncbi:MAG: hypothetical protein RMI01_05135 [Thermodesulfovibrio sp.]|nr:hypothetical protein [Thermodesulfovibrio sp.]
MEKEARNPYRKLVRRRMGDNKGRCIVHTESWSEEGWKTVQESVLFERRWGRVVIW